MVLLFVNMRDCISEKHKLTVCTPAIRPCAHVAFVIGACPLSTDPVAVIDAALRHLGVDSLDMTRNEIVHSHCQFDLLILLLHRLFVLFIELLARLS